MLENYSLIENYSFKKDIGEGNFGKVKLSIFKPTGEEFAIKILNKEKIKHMKLLQLKIVNIFLWNIAQKENYLII